MDNEKPRDDLAAWRADRDYAALSRAVDAGQISLGELSPPVRQYLADLKLVGFVPGGAAEPASGMGPRPSPDQILRKQEALDRIRDHLRSLDEAADHNISRDPQPPVSRCWRLLKWW